MKSHRPVFIKLLIVASVSAMLLAACTSGSRRDSVSEGLMFLEITEQPTPYTGELPYFIIDVRPEPGSVISSEKYIDSLTKSIVQETGIVIEMSPLDFEDYSHNYPEEARYKVVLFVDGNLIPNTFMEYSDGLVGIRESIRYGPYWLSWNPELRAGMHTAMVWIKTSAGDVLAYEWEFELYR